MMNRRKLVITLSILLWSYLVGASAQGIIVAPAHAESTTTIDGRIDTQLRDKMVRVLTARGIAGNPELAHFALVPSIAIDSERTLATLPPSTQTELSVTFRVVDLFSGNVYGSRAETVKATGTNKQNALIKCINALKLDSEPFTAFIDNTREKIFMYYESQVDNIVASSRVMMQRLNYQGALMSLSEVPSSIPSYAKVANLLEECYTLYIEKDAQDKLRQAKALWTANPTPEGAAQVAEVISSLPTGTKADAEINALLANISQRLKEIDLREWEAKLKDAERQHLEKSARLAAAKDLAMELARNQPKTITKIVLW